MPEKLEPDVIYISLRFGLVSHNCCCGCGNEVVMPLAPSGWELTYNGETVSLWPSIGNWGLPCRSHYIITRSTVDWAESWPKSKFRRAQSADASARHRQITAAESPPTSFGTPQVKPGKKAASVWSRIRKRLF